MSGSTLSASLSDVTDFRSVLEQKLKEKKSNLGRVEEDLKKYAPPATQQNNAIQGNAADGNLGNIDRRFKNRLGPANSGGVGGVNRQPLGSRLGPRVGNRNGSGDYDDTDAPSERNGSLRSLVSSRVFVGDSAQASREEAMKEATKDTREVQRSKRMFGNMLLGTLQKFRREETNEGAKEREQKRMEVDKKIEERTEKEREEARAEKEGLFTERKRQRQEIRVLEVQMRRVREFEAWEASKRREMVAVRTRTEPKIYYLPKEHTDGTRAAWDETMEAVEAEIAEGKAKFEDELLKIEEKAKSGKVRLECMRSISKSTNCTLPAQQPNHRR